MDQAAAMFGGSQLSITITSEEEEKYPEAVKCLRGIISRLGPHGESPELQAQEKSELAEVRQMELKLRTIQLFMSAVKEVLNDEQMNGYQKFSKEFVEKILDHVNITEMQQEFKGGIGNVLGPGTLIPPLNLGVSDKTSLMDAVSAKIMELWGSTDDKQKLQQEQMKLLTTLSACREKAKEVKKMSQEHEMLMQKLIQNSEKMELEQMQMEIMKLKMEIDVYKKKIAEVRLAQELYGGVKGEALIKLVSQKQEELQQARAENEGMRVKLAQYASLPQPQFQQLVTQHLEVTKQIENAKWSLQKLEEK